MDPSRYRHNHHDSHEQIHPGEQSISAGVCGMRLSLFGAHPASPPREQGPRLCTHRYQEHGESTRSVCLVVLKLSSKHVPQRNEEKFTLVSDKSSCHLSRRASFASLANDLVTLKILIQKELNPNPCYTLSTFQVHNLEHLIPLFLLKCARRTHQIFYLTTHIPGERM